MQERSTAAFNGSNMQPTDCIKERGQTYDLVVFGLFHCFLVAPSPYPAFISEHTHLTLIEPLIATHSVSLRMATLLLRLTARKTELGSVALFQHPCPRTSVHKGTRTSCDRNAPGSSKDHCCTHDANSVLCKSRRSMPRFATVYDTCVQQHGVSRAHAA